MHLPYHLSTPIKEITLDVNGEMIELWGEDVRPFFEGPDNTCEGIDTWDVPSPKDVLEELYRESGMDWDQGPYRSMVIGAIGELEDPRESIQDPEIEAALDQWRAGEENGPNMNDLHEPSHFLEWNQGEGDEIWVGGTELHKSINIPQYTPEMLFQRDCLNYHFNFVWNSPRLPGYPKTRFEENMIVPEMIELLELVSVGANYGIAKCDFGTVFIPKGALGYLNCNGGATVGTIFDGEIIFSNQGKFPWRLKKDGVTFTYEDMCGTRIDDY